MIRGCYLGAVQTPRPCTGERRDRMLGGHRRPNDGCRWHHRSENAMTRNREDIVAAAFAAAGPGVSFDPIRTLALLFLIDRVVSERIGGPFFQFGPHRYGPHDGAVYDTLDKMTANGEAHVDSSGSRHRYRLSEAGHRRGEVELASFPDPVADYVERVARWVRLMPYRPMLAAIYREYPEMAVNSVIPPPIRASRTRHPRLRSFLQGMVRAFDLMGVLGDPRPYLRRSRTNGAAIHRAWRAVGESLENAMVRIGESERLW